MIRKHLHLNRPFEGPAPEASRALESDGHFLARGLFDAKELGRLRAEVEAVYRDHPPDWRPGSRTRAHAEMFRYQMFNRSAACQEFIGRRELLDILEPLLGDDCHAISCTAWRNPAGRSSAPQGQEWHVDGGPTAVLPGSHKSGGLPPPARVWDLDLEYQGRRGEVHVARAGDVTIFVSDAWHRRMPTTKACQGRFFLQTAFGRREVAQRVLPPNELNCVSRAAESRAVTERQRQVLGLHPTCFYDG